MQCFSYQVLLCWKTPNPRVLILDPTGSKTMVPSNIMRIIINWVNFNFLEENIVRCTYLPVQYIWQVPVQNIWPITTLATIVCTELNVLQASLSILEEDLNLSDSTDGEEGETLEARWTSPDRCGLIDLMQVRIFRDQYHISLQLSSFVFTHTHTHSLSKNAFILGSWIRI